MEEEFEFECQLCGKSFPADPSGIVESINQEELEERECWTDKDWENDIDNEIIFICPECLQNLENYDGEKPWL